MTEPFLGEIRIFAGNFPPKGYAFCQGQILSIQQNAALFSLLGTQYGGNGTTNFGLPDLRGRAPLGQGQGPGLSAYSVGEQIGTESVALTTPEMPAHNHTLQTTNAAANRSNANGAMLAVAKDPIYAAPPPSAVLNPGSLSLAGGSTPHENMQPFLTLNFIIALVGVFPARN
jgi:microcystin-dependent protein